MENLLMATSTLYLLLITILIFSTFYMVGKILRGIVSDLRKMLMLTAQIKSRQKYIEQSIYMSNVMNKKKEKE